MAIDCQFLAIGDEILSGQIADTNSAWLARRLREIGIRCGRIEAVGDRVPAILGALKEACVRFPLVIATGGLGPTFDDLTRDAVAALAGVGLERRPEAVRHLEEWFRGRGRAMPASNLRQADLPAGSEMLENRQGTAPGFAIRIGSDGPRPADLFFLPGVPDEMEAMYEGAVLPRLLRLGHASADAAPFKIHLFGIWESEADRRLREAFSAAEMAHLGIRASGGVLTVAVYGDPALEPDPSSPMKGEERYPVRASTADFPDRLRTIFRDVVFGEGDEDLPGALVKSFRSRGATIAVAESCTGGLVANLIASVPGASAVLDRGWVVYSNEAKAELLGVPPALIEAQGAVSEPVARALAAGAIERSRADISLSVTGIAGPTGGTPEKPVGLVWFATGRRTKGGIETAAHSRHFKGPRQRVQRFAAVTAIDLARRALMVPGRTEPQITQMTRR
jgi:nicotinamide-nucleotide amidase